MRNLKIKKMDDKPMVIHIKDKPKFHVKTAAQTQIKGRNVLIAVKDPKVTQGSSVVRTPVKGRQQVSISIPVRYFQKEIPQTPGASSGKRQNRSASSDGQKKRGKNQTSTREKVHQPLHSENGFHQQYRKIKKERENSINKKNAAFCVAGDLGVKTAIDQMEGGSELYDSYRVADTLARPVTNAVDAGRSLYRRQMVLKNNVKKIKKKSVSGKIGKKAVKKSGVDAAKQTAKETTKKTVKATAKTAVKAGTAAAGCVAGTATTGVGGAAIGVAAGEAVGIAMDRKELKHSTRSRMIRFYMAKLGQQENKDSIGKAVKDIVIMRLTMLAKYLIRYIGLFLLALFAVVALIALPIILVIAVIYNSPFAMFFPSISSGQTMQEVLSGYVSEFNDEINAELANYPGYDESEKIYLDYEGAGGQDNYYDVLAVYLIKHGNGDTGTDMTDLAKENLKKVFDDMCSYRISSRTDTVQDEEGNTVTTSIKCVNVTLRSCRDMISFYSFDSGEQEILAELMKPENLAMIGYTGGNGDSGGAVSPEQYQAIVDAISDANGKKVVEFVLSKVGYPYSQALRDSGNYYDCSSLAYYAWQNAGVSILYEGSNTAASEGKYCYDNNLLVNYEEMQPGDLIFYSYGNNGRFMNITHVAVYVGGGNVVEAANERIGVVFRPVKGRNSIVLIGRPR